MNRYYFLPGILVVFLVTLYNSTFIVDQRVSAVVFQFGEAVRTIESSGLKFKLPFIQTYQIYDKRLLTVEAETKEVTASDEKRLIVDAFAKYKITKPILFYRTVHTYYNAKLRINRMLESAMRKVIGKFPLITLLSEERNNIMKEIKDIVNNEALEFGIQVVDVRITHADLPAENSEAIYNRMQTEREKEAKQIRAEGQQEAVIIMSKADKEKKIILANAYAEAQKIKAEGDAIAAKIYNDTYTKDVKFYTFYRSLESYRKTLSKDSSFVLQPNSKYFKYLNLSSKNKVKK